MAWFFNEESGQTFEAVGVWEKEARSRGCEEIDDPTGKKPEKQKGEPKPEKADAKGGKEKK